MHFKGDIRNENSKECDKRRWIFRRRRKRENKSEDRKPLSEHPGSDLGNVTNIFGSWDQAGAMTGEERGESLPTSAQ